MIHRALRSVADPVRRLARIEAEGRYLLRLARAVAGAASWEERAVAYHDYREAHEQLSRVTRLHGYDPSLLPPLMLAPG